jgi:hypothetical protein
MGKNIARVTAGEEPRRFRKVIRAQGVSIGRRTGVGEAFGIGFHGKFAWLSFRAVLMAVIPSWDRRLHLLADWAIWPIVGRDIAQMGSSNHTAYDVRHHVYQAGETIAESTRPTRLVHVIVEGDVDLLRRVNGTDELVETIGPGDHFGRKALEYKGADVARARSELVRTMALRENQANQLQDALVSTGRIVARTAMLPTINLDAREDEK